MLYMDALAALPYLTGGRSGDQMMNSDRMQAVKRYKNMRDRIAQGRVGPPAAKQRERIIPISAKR